MVAATNPSSADRLFCFATECAKLTPVSPVRSSTDSTFHDRTGLCSTRMARSVTALRMSEIDSFIPSVECGCGAPLCECASSTSVSDPISPSRHSW